MPIDFIPGARAAVEPDGVREARERAALREGMIAAAKTCGVSIVPAAIALIVALAGMKTALVSADQLLRDKSNWDSAFMPLVLFGILGLVLGGFLGWRISEGAGLSGSSAWLIGVGAVLIIVLCGAIAAPFLHASAVPTMCWLALAAVAVASLPGLSYFAFWGQ